MTNYQAIITMTPEAMVSFLDQVYLTGVNTGLYAARQKNDEILDMNPFDTDWVEGIAEEATEKGFDDTGDEYLLDALVKAIFLNAGIQESDDSD